MPDLDRLDADAAFDPAASSGGDDGYRHRAFAAADAEGCCCPLCLGLARPDDPVATDPGLSYLNGDERAGAFENGKPSKTIGEAGAHLAGFGPGWGGVIGQGFTVTYAFRASEPFRMPSDTTGFQRFNAQQILQAEAALTAWADVANIRFVRVGSDTQGELAYSNNAAILFANYSSGESGSAAFANYPGQTRSDSVAGDVWVNINASSNAFPQPGNYGGQVLIHEIGHAIGLTHPGEYNAGDGQSFTYTNDAEYYEDSRQYTVMSYFNETNTGANFAGRYSAVPMLDDIAAAQYEYGANMTTRTGDTTYGFNSNAGRDWFVAESSSTRLIFAVWDAGGDDTFDFSGYAQNQLIDLREGHFSNVGTLTGNVAIAQGARIENAIGGSGADLIHGNALANVLRGGSGADRLNGYDGADTIQGGAGNDTIDGGAGTDVILYSGAFSDYTVVKNADGSWSVNDRRGGAPDGADRLTNIEILRFTDRDSQVAVSLSTNLEAAFQTLLREGSSAATAIETAFLVAGKIAAGASEASVLADIIDAADATSSVATLSYQFFTGRAPTAAGMDFLVSPTGSNANNLNSAYYQGFNLENRYINFAVNLGKVGEGQASFSSGYGALDLFAATKKAYASIFGTTPTDDKVHAILDPMTVVGGLSMSRADYFAYYGQDGANGLGTKAAMVGFLLAEAVKSDLGSYALSNEAYLTALVQQNASFGVDLIGTYNRPEYAYTGG